MRCAHCREELPPGALACPNCGLPFMPHEVARRDPHRLTGMLELYLVTLGRCGLLCGLLLAALCACCVQLPPVNPAESPLAFLAWLVAPFLSICLVTSAYLHVLQLASQREKLSSARLGRPVLRDGVRLLGWLVGSALAAAALLTATAALGTSTSASCWRIGSVVWGAGWWFAVPGVVLDRTPLHATWRRLRTDPLLALGVALGTSMSLAVVHAGLDWTFAGTLDSPGLPDLWIGPAYVYLHLLAAAFALVASFVLYARTRPAD